MKGPFIASRYVDAAGNLHSTRLLTLTGNLPSIFRPFVPVRNIYMIEHVVVNADEQRMEVHTGNINMTKVVTAVSASHYEPVEGSNTRYTIDITVKAFPRKDGESKSGYISSKLEKWAADKLCGNVSKGRQFIDSFCRQHVAMCEGKQQEVQQLVVPSPGLAEVASKKGNEAIAGIFTLGWKV